MTHAYMSAAVYFTVAEAAAILRVSDRTIRRAIADGRLEAVRVGRNVRIDSSSLAQCLVVPAGHARRIRPLKHLPSPAHAVRCTSIGRHVVADVPAVDAEA